VRFAASSLVEMWNECEGGVVEELSEVEVRRAERELAEMESQEAEVFGGIIGVEKEAFLEECPAEW
jgi:hypothetical protein